MACYGVSSGQGQRPGKWRARARFRKSSWIPGKRPRHECYWPSWRQKRQGGCQYEDDLPVSSLSDEEQERLAEEMPGIKYVETSDLSKEELDRIREQFLDKKLGGRMPEA